MARTQTNTQNNTKQVKHQDATDISANCVNMETLTQSPFLTPQSILINAVDATMCSKQRESLDADGSQPGCSEEHPVIEIRMRPIRKT